MGKHDCCNLSISFIIFPLLQPDNPIFFFFLCGTYPDEKENSHNLPANFLNHVILTFSCLGWEEGGSQKIEGQAVEAIR